jgi:transcriptional regulator with XRE-family HTH domain
MIFDPIWRILIRVGDRDETGNVTPRRADTPMHGRSPNPEAGGRLRAVRERLGLSIREVERRSRLLADSKQNREYYISHAWLSQIERGELTPGIYKIYTLSSIYQYRFDEVVAFFGLRLSDIVGNQIQQPLPLTHLLGTSELPSATITRASVASVQLEKTDLVSRLFSGLSRLQTELFPPGPAGKSVFGYIGTGDFTLYPFIRPGSFVEIDSAQRKIEKAKRESSFERPIYFLELHDDYACSWCEEKEGSLLLIPSPQSGCLVRQVRYPADIEVIGRVTAVNMRIADARETRGGGVRFR